MTRARINPMGILTVLSLVFSMMGGYRVFYGGVTGTLWWKFLYYGKFIMCSIWILAAFSRKASMEADPAVSSTRNKIFLLMVGPQILMLVYSIFLWLLNGSAMPYITRGISDWLYTCIALMTGISLVYLYGQKALKYSLTACIITYILSLCVGVVQSSPYVLISAINYFDESAALYTELHEIAFILGMYIIYLVTCGKESGISHPGKYLGLSLLFFYVAGKRIGFAAVAAVLLYHVLMKKIPVKPRRKLILVTAIVTALICILYVSLSTSDNLVSILSKYGIQMWGREKIYRYFRTFCSFSVTYLGRGIGFVSRQFDYATAGDLENMVVIRALHNDHMKLFINLGFIGYMLWLWHYLFNIPKTIRRFAGDKAMYICFLLILYSFVTYLTDNTEGYFLYQMQLCMLFAASCCSGRKLKLNTPEERNTNAG